MTLRLTLCPALLALTLSACTHSSPSPVPVPVPAPVPGFSASASASASASVPPAAASLSARGMTLGLWDLKSPPPATFRELRTLHVTSVALVVRWRQANTTSSTLAPAAAVTIADDELRLAIRRAHAAGLTTFVFPIIDVAELAPGKWRGTLVPDDRDTWWSNYRRFILHYATLAADEHTAAFALGSELGSTESWREHWWALAGAVRARFPGTLVYSANWDHYQHVSFWDRVDAIGVSAYPPLTARDDATAAELEAAWRRQRAQLVAFARRHGKPLWLTEVGVPSRDGAARAPWNYLSSAAIDLEEQRRYFLALARAFADEPTLTGLYIWLWDTPGGPRDGGYTPRGKPAVAIIRGFFSRPTP